MELRLNEKLLFNELQQPQLTLLHVILSSNTNKLKSVLSVNSNVLVSLSLTHKLTFNNMVLRFSMLVLSFNKPVLLVLLRISYV
jgi:hypothetical protein